ncbi:MAG: hypothetical protein K0S37_370 [Microbacterium sp.]|jgi:hypothetical protein|nr:hypothetical protein [Microbacterium sp.]
MSSNHDTQGARRRPGLPRVLHGMLAAGLTAALVGAAAPAAMAAEPAAPAAQADGWAGNTANTLGGTDYYLDATGGDDDNAGTSADAAWQTLAKASATTFEPGDRILLKAGETWNDEQLWPKGSGAEGAPIVIDAYGDETAGRPYIAANGNVPNPFRADGTKNPETVGLTGAVVLRNQQYFEIANLELSNDDDFATDITSGTFVRDGINISINADLLEPGADTIMDHFRISNVFAHDIDGPSYWQKIHYGGINFQVFGDKQYTEYPTGGHYFQDVRIEDNTFDMSELHAIQFAFNWWGANQGQADETGKWHEGWEQLWVRERDLYSRDVYIGHNYAKDTGQGAIQLANTKDMVVEYNEIDGFLKRYSQVSAGLYLWAGADTVMRFNEVYGGPANEYDATPWDLEFTNFDVTYEYNYSHDNEGGWMSYMGNSSNSIARYNLSVNDNGVIWKNMLSSNYSPTYVLNNVFVYDGAELEWIHDEVLKDTVYFVNNVFYNTSTTTTTPWYRKADALRDGVFSHNAYYEASGVHSDQQPADAGAVLGDPKFAGNPAEYLQDGGVEDIRDAAAVFELAEDSPLIDAGRYNPRVGTEDFFGNGIYYGDGVDIGLHEVPSGTRVTDPVDDDPIEEENQEDRVNLALGKPIVASSTHPHNNFSLKAANLVDGDTTTRWAGADDATYPLTIDLDFEAEVTFDEVYLDEFTDSGTDPRVGAFELQRWDAAAEEWVSFADGSGIGHDRVIEFEPVTSSKLRLSLNALLPGQIYAPTLSEIQVYDGTAVVTHPEVTPAVSVYDRNPAAADLPTNVAAFDVLLDGDELSSIAYVQPSGAIVGSLDEDDYRTSTNGELVRYTLTPAFFADKELGTSGLRFQFASDQAVTVSVEIVDTTELEAAIAEADALLTGEADASGEADAAGVALPALDEPITLAALGSGVALAAADPAAEAALAEALADARSVLDAANRAVSGIGNDTVTNADVVAATAALRAAIDAYVPGEPGAGGPGAGDGAAGTPGTGAPGAGTPGAGSPAAADQSGLADTGVEVGLLVGLGALLLALGGAAFVVARRRGAAARG